MTITTEEVETLARKMIDVAAGRSDTNWCNDAANTIRTLAADRDAAIARAEKAEAEAEKLRSVITGVIVAYEYDIAQGVEPSDDRRRVIAVLRAALNQGGDDGRERAKRHHHDGIPDGLLIRGD